MGIYFWIVLKVKHKIHDKPSITEGNHKWNGGHPILIINETKIKYFISIKNINIIEINKIPDPILWTIKYLIIDSDL